MIPTNKLMIGHIYKNTTKVPRLQGLQIRLQIFDDLWDNHNLSNCSWQFPNFRIAKKPPCTFKNGTHCVKTPLLCAVSPKWRAKN